MVDLLILQDFALYIYITLRAVFSFVLYSSPYIRTKEYIKLYQLKGKIEPQHIGIPPLSLAIINVIL